MFLNFPAPLFQHFQRTTLASFTTFQADLSLTPNKKGIFLFFPHWFSGNCRDEHRGNPSHSPLPPWSAPGATSIPQSAGSGIRESAKIRNRRQGRPQLKQHFVVPGITKQTTVPDPFQHHHRLAANTSHLFGSARKKCGISPPRWKRQREGDESQTH